MFSRRLIFCVLLAVLATRTVPATEPSAVPSERDLSQTIVVGAADAFYPYSFRDHDGKLKGFAVDIMDAIAGVMALPIRREVLTNTQFTDQLRNGTIDVVQFWSEVPARRAYAEFSIPIARFETVVVARQDDQRFNTISDLAGRRLAVGQKGNVGDLFVQEKLPGTNPVYTATTEEFLQMLSQGTVDAALMSHATAVSAIDRYEHTNLRVLPIKIRDYDIRYCFAVRKGDTLLLARLNEGLAVIQRSGEYSEIYHRWFAFAEPRKFTPLQVISYVAITLAIACAAVTWGLLRQRALNRRIARQAQELSSQRSLLTALHDNLPVALTVLERTPAGLLRFRSLNHEAQRIHAIDQTTCVGRNTDELTLPEEYRRYLAQVAASWPKPGKILHQEFLLSRDQRLIDTTLVPLATAPGDQPCLCLLASDITEKRLHEIDAARARRLRALGELVGGIAHEFNNLLTPIMLKTSLLQGDRPQDRELQEDLGVISQAATRASDLTRRLLTFGRKNDEPNPTSRFDDVVHSSAALLCPTFDRRILWKTSIPTGLPEVGMATTDLNQIIFNLVINARDALMARLEQNGHHADWTPHIQVTVTLLSADSPLLPEPLRSTAPHDWQQLTVQDNGTGIAPEIVDRIFEPFFTTKEAGKGTGLGLATVWHLAKDARGHVTVRSTPEAGTEFRLLLPVAPAPAGGNTSAKRPRDLIAPSRSRQILLVEDEDDVARTTIAILKKFGHHVQHAADGEQAWTLLQTQIHELDLLLIDINMPRLSGVDLVRRIRTTSFSGMLIIMSGRVAESDLEQLRQLRVDQVLPKPYTIEQLLGALMPAADKA
jgi:signal transduction histidine kinase/CheY-like chemotaxis protein